jgi:hypothetical protein
MSTQTPQQTIEYYANLLIYQYITQPKAYATVYADVLPIIMPQGGNFLTDYTGNALVDGPNMPVPGTFLTDNINNSGPILPLAVQDAFTLGTAVGVQLSILAEYIGAQRTNLQLNGLSLTLTDTQFTSYLTVVAARNNLGSDMGSIEAFFLQYFPGEFTIYDFETMNMGFVYYETFGADPVAESFIMSGYLPVPMAVGATLVYNPTDVSFFAFRTYNSISQPRTSGYNFYSDPQVGQFLAYRNVIIVPFV